MLIDIISDIHINSHFSEINPNIDNIRKFWNKLEPKGEILIIAGDMGEVNIQNVNFLKTLKKLFYKEIICVFGNHDLHCLHNRVLYLYNEKKEPIQQPLYNSYKDKIENAKKLYKENGIILLDGELVNINGIKIGGTMGWYDGKYSSIHRISLGKHPSFQYREFDDLQELWECSMPDSDIKSMYKFNELSKIENEKINNIVENCDIMITHINPSIEKEHQNQFWKDSPTTGFYSFDGKEFLNKFKGKHWIFGHSHFNCNHLIELNNGEKINLISNTLGYSSNNHVSKILTIELPDI
jgi:predicted phosphodiesterase